ncbi:MAG: hypothetical protein GX278_01205 [Aeromonadales bacterium]|nr:hypothetical protein [Aeromonadales bacterium]
MLVEPYFMTNKEWYYHDVENWCLKLTDKAPQNAIDSYNEFYRQLNSFRISDDETQLKDE